jgi:hypothetical protein
VSDIKLEVGKKYTVKSEYVEYAKVVSIEQFACDYPVAVVLKYIDDDDMDTACYSLTGEHKRGPLMQITGEYNEPIKLTTYMNVYSDVRYSVHLTREDADAWAKSKLAPSPRLACKKLFIDAMKGEYDD